MKTSKIWPDLKTIRAGYFYKQKRHHTVMMGGVKNFIASRSVILNEVKNLVNQRRGLSPMKESASRSVILNEVKNLVNQRRGVSPMKESASRSVILNEVKNLVNQRRGLSPEVDSRRALNQIR